MKTEVGQGAVIVMSDGARCNLTAAKLKAGGAIKAKAMRSRVATAQLELRIRTADAEDGGGKDAGNGGAVGGSALQVFCSVWLRISCGCRGYAGRVALIAEAGADAGVIARVASSTDLLLVALFGMALHAVFVGSGGGGGVIAVLPAVELAPVRVVCTV